ncbi:hypothetical protein ACVIWU_006645 [Bradyrhizobium sp. USDA 4509]
MSNAGALIDRRKPCAAAGYHGHKLFPRGTASLLLQVAGYTLAHPNRHNLNVNVFQAEFHQSGTRMAEILHVIRTKVLYAGMTFRMPIVRSEDMPGSEGATDGYAGAQGGVTLLHSVR